MEPLRVFVWQDKEEIPDLPGTFQPIPVSSVDLPVEAPVLVLANQWQSFARAVEPDAEGRLQEAILYLVHHEEPPHGSAPFFDAVVREGDWDALRHYVKEAWQIRLLEYASDLSLRLINQLPYPLEVRHVRRLPLPAEIKRVLKRDEKARLAFSERIEALREDRWSDSNLKPTPQDLADYLLSRFSPATERYIDKHLERSSDVRAEYEFLRQVLLQEPLVEAPVLETAAAEWNLDPALAEQHPLLLLLFLGLLHAHLRPRDLRYFRGGDSNQSSELELDLGKVIASLLSGETVTLVMEENGYEMDIRYEGELEMLILEKLQRTGGFEINVFFVQMRSGDDVVWERRSKAGQAAIPMEVMRKAIDQGANRIYILAA